MENKGGKIFQSAYFDNKLQFGYPFDIVIGSGTKGQSYLYWEGNHLFQLPVSYYTPSNIWINSPGYPSDRPVFNRMVRGRCLECHSTIFKEIPNTTEEYNKDQIIYGVGCEKCHGPAAAHVEFHVKNPEEKVGRYIVNSARFPRQRKLDACALCHSGIGKSLKAPFTFLPGDTLSDYLSSGKSMDTNYTPDVHGNQYQLLSASKCFKMSTMNCSSCHNTHMNERNSLIVFSQKCMNCHSEKKGNFCKMAPVLGASIATNCIDCHMPLSPSKTLTVQGAEQKDHTPVLVRTHFIAVYSEKGSPVHNYKAFFGKDKAE
ncbi:cytochrome c3 family protein [Rubrolithibacter danxiaensis]|uniref:cytochrome c3 family protein n=1 Tax=Rubrolithibacter danxiaensis TaxID=3390805 RepID=UPI003BF8AB05